MGEILPHTYSADHGDVKGRERASRSFPFLQWKVSLVDYEWVSWVLSLLQLGDPCTFWSLGIYLVFLVPVP